MSRFRDGSKRPVGEERGRGGERGRGRHAGWLRSRKSPLRLTFPVPFSPPLRAYCVHGAGVFCCGGSRGRLGSRNDAANIGSDWCTGLYLSVRPVPVPCFSSGATGDPQSEGEGRPALLCGLGNGCEILVRCQVPVRRGRCRDGISRRAGELGSPGGAAARGALHLELEKLPGPCLSRIFPFYRS